MNMSVATDDIDMYDFQPCERVHKERVIEKTPNNKAHITRRLFCDGHEPHPAVRTNKRCEKSARRMDIAPLPRSSLARRSLGIRFIRMKSTAHSLTHGYFDQEEEDERFPHCLEIFELKDAEMGGMPNSPPFAQYEKDMECGYDTMDPRDAFEMSGGVFGYLLTPSTTSTSSSNIFASSTGSGGTASTFSTSTSTSPVRCQPGAAAVSGKSSNVTAVSSKPSSSDRTMDDASAASTDHVAALPSVATAPVPTPPPSQPPKPTNTFAVASPTFTGLGFLPSRRLTSETVSSVQPAAMAHGQATGKSPCAPQIPTPAVAPPPAPPSQREDAATLPLKSRPTSIAEAVKAVVSSPPVEITKDTGSSLPADDTKPATSPPPMTDSKPTVSSPSVEDAKPAVSSSPVANANAPTETSRPKVRPRSRPVVPLVEHKEASKQEVELGMGAFGSPNIQTPKAQISAFSKPYFKKLFGDEMKVLKERLRAKEEIEGTHVVFLWRSLKWITDSHEAKWFDDEIELEDDVAWWRGKLNILRAELEKRVGPDATGIAADTKAKLEKVFVILGGADDLNQEIA